MSVKSTSDVHIRLKLSKLATTNGQNVAILTSGHDSDVHVYNYGSSDDYSKDFDETTSVNTLIEKGFDVADYEGSIEVIVAPSADVSSNAVDTKPTADGANVSENSTNRFVYALKQHIDDGFNYVVSDNLDEKDLEAVSDYLYDTQKALLVPQVKSISDLKAIREYSSKNQPETGEKLNPVYTILETSDRKPAIQSAVYATAKAPIDLMHVSNLSEFIPDDDLKVEDIEQIKELHGSVVVNKADDMMMLQGLSLGDNYADQFVNTKIVKESFRYDLQKQLNQPHFKFDNDGINVLYQTAKGTSERLYDEGYLYSPADVQKKAFTDAEKETRTYNGLSIKAEVASSVETVNAILEITE